MFEGETLISGHEKLIAFGIEDSSDFFVARCRSFVTGGLLGESDYVGGDYVEAVNSDDFCGVGQVHCLCNSDSDSQACEAAGASRNIDVFDFVRFFAEALEQAANGRKGLRAVSQRAGEGCFGK